MAKYKLQELNDLRDEGKRRVYPKMVTNRTLSRKEFVKMMQNYHRGISESTTEAVLTDVVDMLTDMLSMGYNVNLEGFGTFSLSLAFEDEKPREILNPDDKMTYRKVGRACAGLMKQEQRSIIFPVFGIILQADYGGLIFETPIRHITQ